VGSDAYGTVNPQQREAVMSNAHYTPYPPYGAFELKATYVVVKSQLLRKESD
jgi:hypothetical protein